MPSLDSILKDITGLALILAALAVFAVIIRFIFAAADKKRLGKNAAEEAITMEAPAQPRFPALTQGELKLMSVDEKTAALIMGIVSHESGIPLSELNFRSIKLLGE